MLRVSAATLTGLLGDEDRLRVVAAIALGARTIDDVAEAADVSPDDVRRLLLRLVSAGVVAQNDGLRIDEGTDYTEHDVNELLGAYHEDYASLRRYLVDEGLLERTAGVYRRL